MSFDVRTLEIDDISRAQKQYCGMLHFMWRADCGACGKPMEFNKGHRDEVNRL